MTNTPSGSKRPHPDSDHPKRPRERDEPRDWRDIHLSTSRPSDSSSSKRDGGHHKLRKDRRDDKRSTRGGGKDRDRRRDERHDRGSARNEDGVKARQGGLPDSGHLKANHTEKENSEREEGEISAPETPEPLEPLQSARPVEVVSAPEPELDLELATPPPVEDTLAARRARRQAILAKYAEQSATPGMTPEPSEPSSAVPLLTTTASFANPHPPQQPNETEVVNMATGLQNTTIGRGSASATPEPLVFDLTKEEDAGIAQTAVQHENVKEGTADQSAADYDPSMDQREDEQKRLRTDANLSINEDAEEWEEEDDQDDEDVDDMFAIIDSEKPKKTKKKKAKKAAAPALITASTFDIASDAEGYYQVILGEQLDGRYQVFSVLGKGMFAIVVRARILIGDPNEIGKEVAIKITRSQESMIKAGLKEVQVLNKLMQADPEDKRHIVRLDRTFEHRGHLCLVFESLSMNLRDVVKRFGKDVGLNIRAVRAYSHQLFLALGLMKKCNIMHADIKPDNILVNEAKTLIKLCDLGSASDASENDITPYLVSRFYRAPEIILGVPYDPSLDVWSIGCTLYELYTGKILFPGRSNNQMLLLMMELRGRFTSKMIKRAQFGNLYFDEAGAFNAIEINRVTGSTVFRAVHISNPKRDLRARLMPPASAKLKDDELKMISSFTDLLEKCLSLDPAKRITPREALMHPFIRG